MIEWAETGAYASDNRRLGKCGDVAVGAVFLPLNGGKFFRWRVWVTEDATVGAVEGHERSIERAKTEVETRFAAFIAKAGLMKTP